MCNVVNMRVGSFSLFGMGFVVVAAFNAFVISSSSISTTVSMSSGSCTCFLRMYRFYT